MKWLDEPITWRMYFKIAGVSMIIGMIISGIGRCVGYWDDITWKIDEIKASIERKFGKDKV